MKLKIKNSVTMFDFVKGLGMLAVLFAHTAPWDIQNTPSGAWSMSFMMPMFFVTSGYFMKKRDFKNGFRDSIKYLLLPYIYTMTIILAVGLVHRALTHEMHEWFSIFLWPAVLVKSGANTRIGAMWFVFALFLAWTVFYALINLKNEKARAAVFAALGIVGGVILPLELPFQIGQGMIGAFYLYSGYVMKRMKLFEKRLSIPVLGGLLAMWAWVVCFGSMDFAFYDIHLGILSILGGLAGTYLVIRCLLYLNVLENPIMDGIRVIGRYTMWILCIHSIEYAVFPWKVLYLFTGEVSAARVVVQMALRCAMAACGCIGLKWLQSKGAVR